MGGRDGTTVLLVRHAESTDNVARRLGSVAPGAPLTDRGRAQATAVAQRLRSRPVDAVYASPLRRADETGRIIGEALGLPVATIDELREFGLGDTEGSAAESDVARVDAQFLRWMRGDLAGGIDGDETGHEVLGRMSSGLARLASAHPGATLVAVSHGGSIGLAVSQLADNVPDDYAMSHPLANCGVAELERTDDGWTLRSWSGDPDRAPHPGDLVDLVGRADAEELRRRQTQIGPDTSEIGGVPCVHFDIAAAWGTQASFAGSPDLPPYGVITDVLAWLESRHAGSWQVTARPEQVGALRGRGLQVVRELTVMITDSRPAGSLAAGVAVGPAHSDAEFLRVFGADLGPLVVGDRDRPGRHYLVLRDGPEPVGCARVCETGGSAAVSAVAIRADRRGAGLGTALSAAATTLALRQAGLAWLHCEPDLMGFYAAIGYRPLTRHVHLSPAG